MADVETLQPVSHVELFNRWTFDDVRAIYLLTTGAGESAFRNMKTIAGCLADELINAAKGSSNSYAIKKDKIERVAEANRCLD